MAAQWRLFGVGRIGHLCKKQAPARCSTTAYHCVLLVLFADCPHVRVCAPSPVTHTHKNPHFYTHVHTLGYTYPHIPPTLQYTYPHIPPPIPTLTVVYTPWGYTRKPYINPIYPNLYRRIHHPHIPLTWGNTNPTYPHSRVCIHSKVGIPWLGIYIHTRIYICTFISYAYIYVPKDLCTYIYVYTYIFIHVYTNIYKYKYVYIYVHIHIYIYTQIYVYIRVYPTKIDSECARRGQTQMPVYPAQVPDISREFQKSRIKGAEVCAQQRLGWASDESCENSMNPYGLGFRI